MVHPLWYPLHRKKSDLVQSRSCAVPSQNSQIDHLCMRLTIPEWTLGWILTRTHQRSVRRGVYSFCEREFGHNEPAQLTQKRCQHSSRPKGCTRMFQTRWTFNRKADRSGVGVRSQFNVALTTGNPPQSAWCQQCACLYGLLRSTTPAL